MGLGVDWDRLREAALAAQHSAYAPYSGFPVGAAALTDGGQLLVGCNVENASYGLTLCAECGVVSALRAGGGGRLVAVCCVGPGSRTVLPCGRCRQLLWEHGGPGCLVATPGGPVRLAELLPLAFDAGELGPGRAGGTGGSGTGEGAAMATAQPSGGEPMNTAQPSGGEPMPTAQPASEPFDAVDVIVAKRERAELSDAQLDWVIDAYTRGVVSEEQMAALAMAILLNGMSGRETVRLTRAMVASGTVMDYAGLDRPTVDKHSTGGVGDKTTLVLVPLVAACGVAVPQVCGRGLGYTGGTLDKMESIPGWRAGLSRQQLLAQLHEVGGAICAAGEDLAPADRRLYALRDVTGTVESVPLIASSVMSKKIAEGTGALVLDVKVGSGAFVADLGAARELARTMVELGGSAGLPTVAYLTDMQTPLGLTAGNALEVREALEVLAGGGPPDLVQLCLVLAAQMLRAAGRDGVDPATVLADGRAMDAWTRLVRAQGGDPAAPLPAARHTHEVLAPDDGILTRLDARAVGVAAWRLGAGRSRRQDPVQAGAGVQLYAKPGTRVRRGQPLMTLHTDAEARIERAMQALRDGFSVQPREALAQGTLAQGTLAPGTPAPGTPALAKLGAPSPLVIERIG